MLQTTLFAVLSTLFLSVLAKPVPSDTSIHARTFSGRGTWFNVGLGACGEVNQNSDKIVALPSQMYAGGAHCNQGVEITVNGVTQYATVRDECPSCGADDLDMSPSLFEEFAPLSVGVLQINWNFA